MDPFLGEIKLVSYPRIPDRWLPCDGRILNIQTHAALSSLLGSQYGGDGRTTFALPDLRGRVPVQIDLARGVANGAAGGKETVTLDAGTIPAHSHDFRVSTTAATVGGVPGAWYAAPAAYSATSGPTKFYAAPNADLSDTIALGAASLQSAGGSSPHPNMQPYLALQYIICTSGIYPPRD